MEGKEKRRKRKKPRICGRIRRRTKPSQAKTEATRHDIFYHKHLRNEKGNHPFFRKKRRLTAPEPLARRRGQAKTKPRYRGRDRDARLSHVEIQTVSKRDVNLVPVHGIAERPMMLAAGKPTSLFPRN